MDDVKPARISAAPSINKPKFPEPHEVVRMIQATHRDTVNAVRARQGKVFFTDNGC